MTNYLSMLGVVCGLTLCAMPTVAQTQLYETGPSADSSYVRFLNGSEAAVSVVNGAAKIALGLGQDTRVSKYLAVRQGVPLSAFAQMGNKKLALQVTAKPGEFVTLAVLGKDAAAKSVVVHEIPSDFSALQASVSLSNFDESCKLASLTAAAKGTLILDGIAPAQLKRRLINPVKLVVQVNCDGKPAGLPLDMAQLQAGERYSVFLLPSGTGRQTLFAADGSF